MFFAGEIAAFATAGCWAVTSLAFEDAGRKMGTLNLNFLRLLIGFLFLSLFTLASRGLFLPTDASPDSWKWLLLSGAVGIVIGDLLLFEAFVLIGARISMLIYASVPPLSGIFAYLFLGESMTFMQVTGMVITIGGIALVILEGGEKAGRLKFNHPVLGILFAFGGALGQAGGYIIGKFGMGDYDPFAATQIRLIAGILSFILLFSVRGLWKGFFPVLLNRPALRSAVVGSFFGPFIGISLSLFAVQRINPGVASTLISITPILLILYAVFIKKEKIAIREIAGSCLAIAGLGIMFL